MPNRLSKFALLPVVLLVVDLIWCGQRVVSSSDYSDWKVYGGTPDNIHYSTLRQINRANVRNLAIAWTYDSGDAFPDSEMECNPIMEHGVLFVTTPKLRLIALDAATGKLRWSFEPIQEENVPSKRRNRGVTYWEEGNDRRVFLVAHQYLYAIDAESGKPIAGFGDSGRVDLREGLGRDPKFQSISATSPGVVYKDLLILGSIVSEDLPASPGDIRAFDVRTGKIRWTFHTIPHPGEYGYETWPKDAWTYTGGVNDWAGMSLDEKRGWVFAATIHDRKLHAFDKATGELLWETVLPAVGNATPATYEAAGRQYVVIAAGGGKWGSPSGGTYVAFALPKQ